MLCAWCVGRVEGALPRVICLWGFTTFCMHVYLELGMLHRLPHLGVACTPMNWYLLRVLHGLLV